jgi:CheY-like chemotaxis protein
MMPRIDGHGVLRFLDRRDDGEPRQSVIVMSANLQSALETQSARSVYKVLPKPFDIRQLVHSVRELSGQD